MYWQVNHFYLYREDVLKRNGIASVTIPESAFYGESAIKTAAVWTGPSCLGHLACVLTSPRCTQTSRDTVQPRDTRPRDTVLETVKTYPALSAVATCPQNSEKIDI